MSLKNTFPGWKLGHNIGIVFSKHKLTAAVRRIIINFGLIKM